MSRAYLVAGLGFGDEGKGSIVQYLAQEQKAKLVVRYNGGSQAAHNVVLEDGRHHTFSQFGSATFESVPTHLSKFMLVEPHALLSEGRHLVQCGIADPYALLTIDRRALLTTPYHWFSNRVREIDRDYARHGSCGAGIGETMMDWLLFPNEAPVVGDLDNPVTLKKKLTFLQERKIEEFKKHILDVSFPDAGHRALKRIMDPVDRVVESYSGMTSVLRLVDDDHLEHAMRDSITLFEGAQGVLLDQDYGFQPHTTWTDITFKNAITILQEMGFPGIISKVGVVRSYMTRHGNGPLPTEQDREDHGLDRHNGTGLWQGRLRIGAFDTSLVKYSLDVLGGVDEIAMTHLDQRDEFSEFAYRYYGPKEFVDESGFLNVRMPASEEYQRNMAQNLISKAIAPTYLDQPSDAESFVSEIATRLHTPITILSEGPCISDKTRL